MLLFCIIINYLCEGSEDEEIVMLVFRITIYGNVGVSAYLHAHCTFRTRPTPLHVQNTAKIQNAAPPRIQNAACSCTAPTKNSV